MTSQPTTWDGQPIANEPPYGATVVVYRAAPHGPEFLLLHRSHHGPDFEGDWAWTPPAGARLPGESIESCARRELLEEAGLTASIALTGHGSSDWAVFQAQLPDAARVVLGDSEHDRFEWVGLDEVRRRCLPAFVAEAVELVGDGVGA
jgi:8-oxo-dGTP pyrophosphatase MutT (NUDIX family)